ncbi:hypothetical protein J6590_080062 [Homalodisca vitripennis]|nr:hypothetical protein J6590_080062 [Homalodisca vitripennis]
MLCLDICKYYLRVGLIAYLLSKRSGAEVGSSERVTIMDQPSTSSTNRSELVCHKYYLRMGLIAYLLSERFGGQNECMTIMDQPSTSSTNCSELVCRSVLSGMLTHCGSLTSWARHTAAGPNGTVTSSGRKSGLLLNFPPNSSVNV